METIDARPIPTTIPGFTYRGIEVPPMTLSGDMIADLGTGKPAYELAPKSTPLAYRVALYSVGRDLAWGEPDAEKLPSEVKEAGNAVYQYNQKRPVKGGWHKDGVLFLRRDETPKGMTKPRDESYVLAKYFRDIAGFDEKNNYRIKPLPETIETLLWLPAGDRFYVPTHAGIFHPVTGTPFETVENEKEAIRRWMETGLTKEQAERELSKFHRGSEGTKAVFSWSDGDNGSLCVYLYVPRSWDGDIGSFPASRSPSGARQTAESSKITVNFTPEEFKEYTQFLDRLASKIRNG